MKISMFNIFISILILNGCSSGIRFYTCPHELAPEMASKTDMGQKKEVLAHQDYRVLVVQKSNSGSISVVQHYRPEHTFGNRTHSRAVSYDDPLTLTALIIVEEIDETNGIAIKKLNDNVWRVYWLTEPEIKDLRKTGVVYLPPYEGLPLLQN